MYSEDMHSTQQTFIKHDIWPTYCSPIYLPMAVIDVPQVIERVGFLDVIHDSDARREFLCPVAAVTRFGDFYRGQNKPCGPNIERALRGTGPSGHEIQATHLSDTSNPRCLIVRRTVPEKPVHVTSFVFVVEHDGEIWIWPPHINNLGIHHQMVIGIATITDPDNPISIYPQLAEDAAGQTAADAFAELMALCGVPLPRRLQRARSNGW